MIIIGLSPTQMWIVREYQCQYLNSRIATKLKFESTTLKTLNASPRKHKFPNWGVLSLRLL